MERIVLGPFVDFDADIKRTKFVTPENAFVPKTAVFLENDRIYKILEKDGFYVIYETENVEFYKPYLAKLPENAEELVELKLPRCPKCGSWDVDVDSDEMFCARCHNSDFWHVEVVWKAKPLPSIQLVEGEGVFVPQNFVYEYRNEAGHVEVVTLKELARGLERLGNVEVEWVEFVGCVDESHWDEAPQQYNFAVYRRYSAVGFDKKFTVKVRDLSNSEKLELFNEAKSLLTKTCLLQSIAEFNKEVAITFVLEHQLYTKYPYAFFRKFDDGRIKSAVITYNLEQLRSSKSLDDAMYYVSQLKLLGYDSEETRAVEEKYKQEKERKRREEEERRRERTKKLEETLKNAFGSIPVEVTTLNNRISVKLTRFVDSATFNKYVTTCKNLGLVFDPRTKTWWIEY